MRVPTLCVVVCSVENLASRQSNVVPRFQKISERVINPTFAKGHWMWQRLGKVLPTRDGHGIRKCSPCPSMVFLMLPGPSVRFHVFLGGGEYVCPSYGPLKFLKSAKSGRKSVRPFIKKLRNPYLPKKC